MKFAKQLMENTKKLKNTLKIESHHMSKVCVINKSHMKTAFNSID